MTRRPTHRSVSTNQGFISSSMANPRFKPSFIPVIKHNSHYVVTGHTRRENPATEPSDFFLPIDPPPWGEAKIYGKMFPTKLFVMIATYFFYDFFERWHRDHYIPVVNLTVYNTELRPFIDSMLCSATRCLHTVIRETFWSTMCQRSLIRIQRRFNLMCSPWAFPMMGVSKYVKRVEFVMHVKDREDVSKKSYQNERQGDMQFLKNFMEGKYGFEYLEDVVIWLQGEGEREREQIKGSIREHVAFGLQSIPTLRHVSLNVNKNTVVILGKGRKSIHGCEMVRSATG
ncbi:hypothetical protein P280DRAFT_485199 [Massarina eburnea CBS 473.64]|uniref:Uncharacterized protein n=1 Tax=Massarina eburnea CBS 473.64 TaxID=1395130 RepID=A0A6A6RHN7_9PLEO|nr:hypothetical protein P280DRAFT_485199 [Massarina eburnea CBS 473.64]